MFERVLIANRGEIACRVIRTCRRMGIHTIAVYSEADANAQHVRLADEAWPIGGSPPAESYLRSEAILKVAHQAGAQAIHPGYGFLSENATFARTCADAGIAFIGPTVASIEAMGSKAAAKALMEHHAVPLVPGYHGERQDADWLAEQARKTGFPLMLKPAAGGGGKGMHIVRRIEDFADTLLTAQREATSSFGDARMILERYVEHPRHIEFQIFGDTQGHVIHLHERECSAQRRYQKVLEETPSASLGEAQRVAMGAAAVAAAKAVKYVGAGTVEFIVARNQDGSPGEFFFMEMNTRLQVEHAVTEMTLGLDLVEWQLRVANGEPLPLTQEQVHASGHAIEVRLYAEDPDHGFLPSSGKLQTLRLPATSRQVRLDGGVIAGDTVTIFYDPMIAKLIVWGANRDEALQRLREALAACEIVGPKSNIGFLERMVRHPAMVEGRIDTGYLDRHLDEFVTGTVAPTDETLFAAATAALLGDEQHGAVTAADPHSPWARTDAWRVGRAGKRVIALTANGERYVLDALGDSGNYVLHHGEASCEVAAASIDAGHLSARFDGTARRIPLRVDATRILLHDADGQRHNLLRAPAYEWETTAAAGGNQVVAPMPGRIVLVKAKAGDAVEQGQELLVMEAMKMELALKAPRAGTIASLDASAGEFVEADSVLVRFAE